jgi:maltose O-acetyltransferase
MTRPTWLKFRIAVGHMRAAFIVAGLALFGHDIEVGERAVFFNPRPQIKCQGKIVIGDSFRILGRQAPVQLTTAPGATLRIGDHSSCNQGAVIYAAESVTIGDHVMIGDYAAIYDTGFHAVDETHPPRIDPVVIEDGAWLARGALVLPGVTVGHQAVVAAGSVVNEDVPPRTLVAGNPAKPVRELDIHDGWVRRWAAGFDPLL